MTYAATGKPNKNPAQGVIKTPKPPRPPERSGNPSATRNRNKRTARPPRFAPNTVPQSIMPMLCAVIGIPLASVTLGRNPRAAIMAAKRAIKTMFFSIFSFLDFFQTTTRPDGFRYVLCIIQDDKRKWKNYPPSAGFGTSGPICLG